MRVVVTGSAGFIGFHTSNRLLDLGFEVFGIDSMNSYYNQKLKEDRNSILGKNKNFKFTHADIADNLLLTKFFESAHPDYVVHLAAQAGVRYSIDNPLAYGTSNLSGFLNILEQCRRFNVQHLVYASSSSVYGNSSDVPFSIVQNTDYPISLYAATKKANEVMAHSYSHLYNLSTSGLRYFTVYGPWGRPDMAIYKFALLMLQGKPIEVYADGTLERDFTFVDDIVDGTIAVMKGAKADIGSLGNPYALYNIGNGAPVSVNYMLDLLASGLGISPVIQYLPMQPGDVNKTYADTRALEENFAVKPKVSLEEGIDRFCKWFQMYHMA